jgi:hypothetical protein
MLGVRRDLERGAAARIAKAARCTIVVSRPVRFPAIFERWSKRRIVVHPTIRRHAIFKREYRRIVARTADFHNLTAAQQWALLRGEVLAGAVKDDSALLAVLDSREPRREQVLAGLEDARRLRRKETA